MPETGVLAEGMWDRGLTEAARQIPTQEIEERMPETGVLAQAT